MNANFLPSIHFVLPHECVYVPGHDGDLNFVITENVPGDGGGLTKFGIDQASHPHTDIAALTLDEALQIYREGEWNGVQGDQLPNGWDTAAFDCAVNNGTGTAIQLMQRTLLAFSQDIGGVDGDLGPKTLAAVTFLGSRPEPLAAYLRMRCNHYRAIVEAHPHDAEFLHGWLNRVNDLAQFLGLTTWEDQAP